MFSLDRRLAGVGSAIAVAVVAVGCGMSHAAVKSGAKKAVSPCGTASTPAWSPDGKQIAWSGYRWPLPPNHHAAGSYNTLRAICISDANGKHLHPLPNTVCSEHCPDAFGDWVGQLDWVRPGLLLFGSDDVVSTISVGGKAKLLSRKGPDPYAVDAGGDRVATGTTGCSSCSGPVKVFGVPSGSVVGVVGNSTKAAGGEPSFSPDGTQVVFTRTPATDSGPAPSIWIASADGSHLRRLERSGVDPLWSPAGNRIVYAAPVSPARDAWRLVAPQGGASRTLLRSAPGTVFGWSPDGRWIAFPDSKNRLAVVNVATGKVRRLLRFQKSYDSSSVAWSPSSQQLLVIGRPPAGSKCPSGLWRVPVGGARPHLVHGC
jgi:Tol biopolymer transport system component